jgi:peptidoglycan hydrolase CwlO-like protein
MTQRTKIMKLTVICLFTVTFSGIGVVSAQSPAEQAAASAELKEWAIVPCLLPARIRRLGGLVYPERRQLTQTTAKECELRGGEYTTYDRATPEASVAFFLPLAEAGDPAAQTRLGEVYQHLFEQPRLQEAAAWYGRAADQGDVTAKRRLAHMYENGLGVQQDTLLATNLWRQAVGIQDELVLASELDGVRTAAESRIEQLTQQLQTRSAEADTLRVELAEVQQEVVARRASVSQTQAELTGLRREIATLRDAQQAGDPARLAALERELGDKQHLIETQTYQLENLEASLDAQQANLQAGMRRVELENRRLQTELARVSAMSELELASAKSAFAAKEQEVATLRREQAELIAALDDRRRNLEAVSDRLAALQNQSGEGARAARQAEEQAAALVQERRRLEESLLENEQKAEVLAASLAGVVAETETLRRQLDDSLDERRRLEAELAQTESELVAMRQRESAATAEVAELRNEVESTAQERDRLAAAVAAAGAGQSAEVVQLREALREKEATLATQEGRLAELREQAEHFREESARLRDQWSLQLATRSVVEPLPDTSRLRIPAGVTLGKYYALVIGNNNYEHLRSLNFAQNDARAVHEVLTQKYGFQSELLLDGTRGEIFRRVDMYKSILQPADSLLIYYAGHGSQDASDSYWMGVDAVSVSSGSLEMYGVSSSAMARWLAAVPARHVLVIADSCYSGRGIVTSGGVKFTAPDIQATMKFYLQNRARTVLTSGGVVPVPDGGGGEHSVFTKALIGLLNQNQGVLFDNDLYAHLKERVRYAADSNVAAPEPIFGRIEIDNGHGSGQFAFMLPSVTGRL